MQHSDMSERDVNTVIQTFIRAHRLTKNDSQQESANSSEIRYLSGDFQRGENSAVSTSDDSSRIHRESGTSIDPEIPIALLTTDPPLHVMDKKLQPIAPTLMINYEIPQRKVRRQLARSILHFYTFCPFPCSGVRKIGGIGY